MNEATESDIPLDSPLTDTQLKELGAAPEAEMGETPADTPAWDWKDDKHNPYNWSKTKKNIQLVTIMSIAFTR
jgi:hypothetical protein